jgi:hypothetical protein
MARSAVAEPLTVGALGGAALVLIEPPDTGIPWCPSALVFGVVCPLCGLTRGVARLVRGDIAASVEFHPLAWAVLAVAGGAWIAWFGRRAGWWSWRSVRVERLTLAGLAAGLVVTWIWRAVTGTLPTL